MWTDEAWSAAHEHQTGLIFREVKDVRAARIPHTCGACGDVIPIGHPYRREVTMVKGTDAPRVYKEHAPDCYGG